MPLSTIARVGFDANIAHTKNDFKRPTPPRRRKSAPPDPGVETGPSGFHVIDEGAVSTAGLSILAQALAAYSEN
jgi:hypothetical protein